MPAMEWANFQDAHHRAHLLTGAVSKEFQQDDGLVLIMDLLQAAGLVGNYALRLHEGSVLIAFERDADASNVAELVGAKPAGSDEAWSSRFNFTIGRTLDRAATTQLRERSQWKQRRQISETSKPRRGWIDNV